MRGRGRTERVGRPARTSLATRIAALAVAVTLLTALVGGAISVRLLRVASEQTAQRSLAAIADEAQATATTGTSPSAGQNRARKALQSINVQIGVIRSDPDGTVSVGGDALARRALTTAQVREVLDGRSLSLRQDRGEAGVVYVEARPTDAGGLVLAQRRGDATALSEQALRQLTWSLVLTALVAVALALLVAWRLSLPLRRTATAATALAEGHRDVEVPETGPREVAEVAGSVNRLASALRHSEARQREFLLSVSHDLRTPLTAITGYAESLADGVVPPGRVPEVGSVLGAESARLQRMVSDLLDLARLDAQEVSLHPVPLDLVGFATDAATVWDRRCAAQSVPFALERGAGPLPVVADPQRLRQAVDGLLENALRVTPAGRPIVLAVARRSGPDARPEAVLEVRDGGPGLTDADLPVAFDRSVLFERYRGVRQVGTGLGLAIVHRIVTRLGGRVEAGHAAEGGARFTVALPVAGTGTPHGPGAGIRRSDDLPPPSVTIG